MKILCRYCGLNNEEGEILCSRCGSPLKEIEQVLTPIDADENNFDPMFVSEAPNENEVEDFKKTWRANNRNGNMRGDFENLQEQPYISKRIPRHISTGYEPLHNDYQEEQRNPVVESTNQTSNKKEVAPRNHRIFPDKIYQSKKADDIKAEEDTVPEPAVSSAKKTERFITPGQNGGNVSKKTVNIFQEIQPKPEVRPHFTLELLRWDNETAVESDKKIFNSSKVVLNRQNTEPENNSITSNQQAILSFENGKWYIEDKSSFKTTFIRVTKKTALEQGDIIVLGNREFKFSDK